MSLAPQISTLSPAVGVSEVGFSYGSRTVLDKVNLEVSSGEVMGLVGPNGSGKTTLLRVIGGTLASTDGDIRIHGQQLSSLKPRERAQQVAMVHQNPAVPPGFTGLDTVMMGRNPYLGLLQWEGPQDLEVCGRVMALTETQEYTNRYLSSLSGGELQRVFIARALAQEASVLILDEPTTHLDVTFQISVLDIIEKVRRETGVSVLIAMHDLTLAAQYCDRIAVLNRGQIHACGEPEEILTAELVSRVFGAPVSILRHPVHNTVVVLPLGSKTVASEKSAE